MNSLVEKPDVSLLDIAHILQKKILYLNGGKDKDGHPLMICDYTDNDILYYTDDVFYKTFLYLNFTAKTLWKNSKIVIIINRSTTKWASVIPILESIDLFPPNEIEHILLLKPQGFMQKHFGKVDMKKLRNSSNHRIIFVDNVLNLEEYIEKVDLPSQFGGCDYFNVNEWVEYTMAVERFQVTCQKVEDRVTKTKELFSNSSIYDIEEVDKCSKDYLQLVDDIQNEIKCTIEIAETLAPLVDKSLGFSHKRPSSLEEYNSLQLKLYADILKNLGNDIDSNWEDQKVLLDETRKICSFDKEDSCLTKELLSAIEILKSQIDIGNSLKDVLELTEELDGFEASSKTTLEKSTRLMKNTSEMIIRFLFYETTSVSTKLFELKKLCETYETTLSQRRETMQISFHVFKCLDQLESWCKSAIELLVSQPVESLSTKEGAKECLLELELFIKNKKNIDMKNMNKMDTSAKNLNNEFLISKVHDALERMDEVKGMLEKRETSLTKIIERLPQPMQTNTAIIVDASLSKDSTNEVHLSDLNPGYSASNASGSNSLQETSSNKTENSRMNKKDIKLIPIDIDEKRKRNRLRKSMKLALKRPVSSEVQEDPEFKRKISLVVTELINTEYVYVNDLRCIIDGYITVFNDHSYDVPDILSKRKQIIFGNIEQIFDFHNSFFLEELKNCKDTPYSAGHVFLNQRDKFNLYADYCKNKAKSEVVRKELATTSSYFEKRQKELGHKLDLDSYLLKPVQRITKYQLLLTEMLKYVSKKNIAHNNIMQALYTMKKCLRHVNDVMHSTGLIGFPTEINIDNLGKLILRDSFTIREGKKNALKQLTKLGERSRQVFLFESCIVISKKEIEGSKVDIGTYLFKDCISTSEIGLTEIVKGEELTFELWIHGRDEILFLQAESLEVKNTWLVEIRRILMSQFQGVKKNVVPNNPTVSERPKIVNLDFGHKASRLSSLSSLSKSESELVSQSSEFDDFDQFYDDDSGWSESEFGGNDEDQSENYDIDDKVNNNVLINVNTFEVIADYDGLEEAELSLCTGDLVNLLKEGEEGWWFCRNIETKNEGWVPSSYLVKSGSSDIPNSIRKNKIETEV